MKSFVKKANCPDEIKSVLMFALAQEREFSVWQRAADNTLRFNIKAKIHSVDDLGNVKFLPLVELPEAFEGEVYFAIEDSTILFKTSSARLKGRHIFISLPSEASYRERRRHKRIYFKFNDHKDVELTFERKPDEPESEEGPIVVNSKVLDISESGACFIVSKATLMRIDPVLLFNVKSLSDIELGSSKAKIMNARKFRGRKLHQEELYLIGIMFC